MDQLHSDQRRPIQGIEDRRRNRCDDPNVDPSFRRRCAMWNVRRPVDRQPDGKVRR